MAKRKSQAVIDLEERVRRLQAYEEAFYCLRAGMAPVRFSSGEDDREVSVELLGPSRASGGVVIHSGGSVEYATDWLLRSRPLSDPYLRDVVCMVERVQIESVRKRLSDSGILSIPEDRRSP